MEEKAVITLVERMVTLSDRRVISRCDHALVDIVVLSLCAVMCGADGWDDIEEWGREKEEWLRHYVKLRNGIFGHDTIRRVFEIISAVKDNQPTLAEAIRQFFSGMENRDMTLMTCNVHETVDKGHGRFETRRCTAVSVDWLDDLDLRARWPKLNSVWRALSHNGNGEERSRLMCVM